MKHPTAKHDDARMRFYTPELLARLNSPDGDVADEAELAWDQADADYSDHLSALDADLPGGLKQLADANFHDATLLHVEQHFDTLLLAIVPEQADHIVLLHYRVPTGAVAPNVAATTRLGSQRIEWLYDEVDRASQGCESSSFVHRILLSDRSVLAIECTDAHLSTLPLSDFAQVRQTA